MQRDISPRSTIAEFSILKRKCYHANIKRDSLSVAGYHRQRLRGRYSGSHQPNGAEGAGEGHRRNAVVERCSCGLPGCDPQHSLSLRRSHPTEQQVHQTTSSVQGLTAASPCSHQGLNLIGRVCEASRSLGLCTANKSLRSE